MALAAYFSPNLVAPNISDFIIPGDEKPALTDLAAGDVTTYEDNSGSLADCGAILDLGSAQSVDQFTVWARHTTGGAASGTIYADFSSDGLAWLAISSQAATVSGAFLSYNFAFASVTARYLRWGFDLAAGSAGTITDVSDMRAYLTASEIGGGSVLRRRVSSPTF